MTKAETKSVALTPQKERMVKLSNFLVEKAEDFKEVATVNPDKFLRVVKNAVLRDPEIAEASMQSVYLECMKAMNDGLVLDGREAALTRFKTNKRKKNPQSGQWEDNWQVEVVYIPMMAGIMKRVRASGEIKAWTVELVYEEEYKQGRFKYIASPDPMIMHEPIIIGDRGPVVAAYSAVKLMDGSYHYEVMTRAQLDVIKNRTKSKRTKRVGNEEITEITGPWATDEEEMFRKTVIRRHSKRLPVSSATSEMIGRVDGLYDRPDLGDGDVDGAEGTLRPRSAGAGSKLKKLTAQAAKEAEERAAKEREEREREEDEGDGEPTHTVIDGEVIDGKTGEVLGSTGGGAPDPDDEF